jgi:hypothetical protein
MRVALPYSVRYDAINAMLLIEFLKEHREVTKLKSELVEQRKQIETLTDTLNAQARKLSRVSAHIEANQGIPVLAANNQEEGD